MRQTQRTSEADARLSRLPLHRLRHARPEQHSRLILRPCQLLQVQTVLSISRTRAQPLNGDEGGRLCEQLA